MKHYSVKKLAKLSGISVRTLHHYDNIGLLKPLVRTEAMYRLYGESELLRLQQILFYRELGFTLKEIALILDAKDYDVVKALRSHKQSINAEIERMKTLQKTIDTTIKNLKNRKVMKNPEELYEGFNKETAQKYRAEASAKYGEEMVAKSEKHLMSLGKKDFKKLQSDFEACNTALFALKDIDPTSDKVQVLVAQHYQYIRQFWGTAGSEDKQAEAYAGLGQLYVDDERFSKVDGVPQPAFAKFLQKAMAYFAKQNL